MLAITNTAFMAHNHRRVLYDDIKSYADLKIAFRSDEYAEFFSVNETFLLGDHRSSSLFSRLASFVSLFKLIWIEKPDKVISFTTEFNLMCLVISVFLKFKHYPNVSGTGRLKDTPLAKIYVNMLLLKCQKVFVQNQRDYNLAMFSKEKLILLPGSGVDLIRFKREKLSNIDTVHFIFIGRLLESKGYKLVLGAYSKLKADGMPAKLTIIGDDRYSKGRADLQEIDTYDEDNFSWVRWTKTPEEYLKNTHCFILPSTYGEGVPKALLEAISCGNACIVSNEIGLIDAVKDCKNGLVLTELTIDAVSDAMKQMIQNKHQLMEFQKNSRNIAEKYFDQNLVVEKYREVLQD